MGSLRSIRGCLQHLLLASIAAAAVAHAGSVPVPSPPAPAPTVPIPNARQLEFMEMEFVQFMHFGAPTFWKPSDTFLRGKNPTVGGNCQIKVTGTSNDSQTAGFWPCLNPTVFAPEQLDVEQWMEAASALGMKEICLTAKHFGGFTLWPSAHTPYGVHAATSWRGGKGDVLRAFADAANRWGIKICYYSNPRDDGFLAHHATGPADFEARQLGMMRELIESYGPINRFWFDGGAANPPDNPEARPLGTNGSAILHKTLALIREMSPATLISPSHGDICATTATLYTQSAPQPNSSDPAGCATAAESGEYFHPTEMHGITMQQGPDGNTDGSPTYWFWHPWACAGNVTGCPWVGHANASRIFDGYVATVGHGGVLNMNIAPDMTGRLNASVVAVMHEAGLAINSTFHLNDAGAIGGISGPCEEGLGVLTNVTGLFDFVVTQEDLRFGQRIGNYSIDFRRRGSTAWEVLIPAVQPRNTSLPAGYGDRPDGHDPRDSHVGHKRIDTPVVPTSGVGAIVVEQVRFNCLRAIGGAAGGPVHLRRLSLHLKRVPWGN